MLQITEKIDNKEVYISSREISELANKRHSHCLRDIREQMKGEESKYGSYYLDDINRQRIEYLLPKNIALGIASGYSFNLRMKIINRLEELEEKNNTPLTYEQTMQNALLLADNRVKELEHKIIEDKPLTDFGRAISSSSASISVGAYAKAIESKENVKFGRNKLFKWLRDNNFLSKKNEPYQRFVDQGIFEVVETSIDNGSYSKIQITTKITGKGQEYLYNKIIKRDK